jgi:type IX secretion system PorP/SprF family membrane protein
MMMKKTIVYIFALGCFAFGKELKAQQDVHFSQFFASPMTVNPASAGAFGGDIRGILNYRNQWASISEPYTTIAASFDAPVLKRMKGGMFGLGLNFYKDDAGLSKFSNVKYSLALAYHLDLNGEKNHFISVGFQAGAIQRSINYNNLTFDDQWNGVTFDNEIPTLDQFGGNAVNALDMATGIHWYYSPTVFTKYFAGVSLYHLNAPNVSFNEADDPMLRKFTIHAGAEIGRGSVTSAVDAGGFSVLPNFIYSFQGPNRYFNLGAEAKFRLQNASKFTNYHNEMSMSIGPYMRFGDAFYAVMRFNWMGFSLGVSYDINISDLTAASSGNGGYELMIGYFGNFGANPSRSHSVRFN